MTTPTEKRRLPVVLIAVVAVFVLAVVAWSVWPSGAPEQTVLRAGSEHYTVRLSVNGPEIGANTLAIDVEDPHGAPVPPLEVTVETVMPQMGHTGDPVPATPDGSGGYRAADVSLPMAGQWEITVTLHGAPGADRIVFPLLVKG